jgi:hypothetical protein
MRWNIPWTRKVYLLVLLAACIAAGVLAYRKGQSEPRLTYERECQKLCEPMSSQVKRTYLNPINQDPNAYRNLPRKVECLCGGSVTGTRLR